MYDYKEDAPFKLTVDNQPYIPEGQGADVVLLQKIIGLIYDGASAVDKDKLCTQLSLLYCVPNLKKRVIKVMKQATVLIATDVWKKLDDLRIDSLHTQEIVNDIGACCDANQAAIQHVEAETKGNSASLETKIASLNNKIASELTVTKKQIALDLTITKTQVAHELTATKTQVAHELVATKTQVAHELAKTKTDVALLKNATKAEFDGTKAQLTATKAEVAILEQRLASIEQNQSPNPFFFYSLSQQLITGDGQMDRRHHCSYGFLAPLPGMGLLGYGCVQLFQRSCRSTLILYPWTHLHGQGLHEYIVERFRGLGLCHAEWSEAHGKCYFDHQAPQWKIHLAVCRRRIQARRRGSHQTRNPVPNYEVRESWQPHYFLDGRTLKSLDRVIYQ
jgi:hypothetical protein